MSIIFGNPHVVFKSWLDDVEDLELRERIVECLNEVGTWQNENGTTPDGLIGPNTIRAYVLASDVERAKFIPLVIKMGNLFREAEIVHSTSRWIERWREEHGL